MSTLIIMKYRLCKGSQSCLVCSCIDRYIHVYVNHWLHINPDKNFYTALAIATHRLLNNLQYIKIFNDSKSDKFKHFIISLAYKVQVSNNG